MTPRRINRRKLREAERKVPVAVICSNVTHFHYEVMIRYAFYDFEGFRYTYDEPSFNEIVEVARTIGIPFTAWTFIESRCHSCRTGVPL